MTNYATIPDKNVGDPFTQPMWATYIEQNMNLGVLRPLQEVVLGSPAASVAFASIPGTFASLNVVASLVLDSGSIASVLMRLNSDSGGNYDWQHQSAVAAVTSAAESIADTAIKVGEVSGAVANCALDILVPCYAGGSSQRVVMAMAAMKSANGAGGMKRFGSVGWWRNNTAINRIDLSPATGNFNPGSIFTLYGLPI
jgi:hypothetical protein